jgi:periplasmic protein TonB
MSYFATSRGLPESASRGGIFMVIVLAHVVILAATLAVRQHTISVVPGKPIEVVFIPGEQKPLPPRPLIPVKQDVLAVDVIMPLVEVAFVTTESTAITVPHEPSAAPRPAEAEIPVQVETVDYVTPLAPRYPLSAMRARVQGLVLLRVLIDATGHPAQVLVHQSSGNRELDDAARKAVLEALFRPYQVSGVARSAVAFIPIEFKLPTRSARAG